MSMGISPQRKLVMEENETVLCGWCAGSGEGRVDGSTCYVCKGLGEVTEVDDD